MPYWAPAMARRQEVLLRSTASFAPVLVQQHADQQGQRVTAEQFVGGVVLSEVEGRHAGDLPDHGQGWILRCAQW